MNRRVDVFALGDRVRVAMEGDDGVFSVATMDPGAAARLGDLLTRAAYAAMSQDERQRFVAHQCVKLILASRAS